MVPSFTLRFGRFFAIEADTAGLFFKAGPTETYARLAEPAGWWTLRDPGSWEASAGRFRLTVSWAVPQGERLGDALAREVAEARGGVAAVREAA